MKPSVALEANRTAVRSAVARSKTANPRVFGSVLYGKDREGSDLDLLVTRRPAAEVSKSSACASSSDMNPNRLDDYLGHMLEAAQLACSYVEGASKEVFLADKRTQQAIILNIIVLGVAATKISQEHPDFIAQHAGLPWKSMKGMRNRVAHGYFDIDLDIVWETVRTALPKLVDQLIVLRGKTSGDSSA